MDGSATMKPRTPEELLALQAAAAKRRLMAAAVGLGEELSASIDLRGRIRRHPFRALALAGGVGCAAGPALLRALKGSPLLLVALGSLLRRGAAARLSARGRA